jgi:hypothetical protein
MSKRRQDSLGVLPPGVAFHRRLARGMPEAGAQGRIVDQTNDGVG